MIKFEHPNPKTLVINGNMVEFQQSVAETISLSDRIIVLLETDDFKFGDKMVGRNLLAFGSNGEQLWRVADHGMTMRARREDKVTKPSVDGRRRVPQSIFDVSFYAERGTLRAGIIDFILTIDPADGKIIEMDFHR